MFLAVEVLVGLLAGSEDLVADLTVADAGHRVETPSKSAKSNRIQGNGNTKSARTQTKVYILKNGGKGKGENCI